MSLDHKNSLTPTKCGTPWMRHSHAGHALARGAELTSTRDNLRHASIATTSTYLRGDDLKLARQLTETFASRNTKGRHS